MPPAQKMPPVHSCGAHGFAMEGPRCFLSLASKQEKIHSAGSISYVFLEIFETAINCPLLRTTNNPGKIFDAGYI
jgi:hypothetical protein